MTEQTVAGNGPGLSQVERVVDTFIAPSKTFTDILRSTSWWLPLVIMVIITATMGFAIDRTVGFNAVAEQQMTKSPSQAERMNSLPADQRAHAVSMSAKFTKIFTYAAFVPILIFVALHALLLWATFNFGLGARTTFGQVFAVIMYAGLPKIFVSIVSVVLLFAGVGTENFDIQNPVGTNVGFYITNSPALRTTGSFIDFFGLWSLALLVMGMAIISRKSIGQAAAVVVGWWVIAMLLLTGFTAAFS